MSPEIWLRPSMLPGYEDCARRSAASQFFTPYRKDDGTVREPVFKTDCELRRLPANSSAAIGTAVHYVVAKLLAAKKAGIKEEGTVVHKHMVPAMATFELEGTKYGGMTFDSSTDNANDAASQIASMARSFETHMVSGLQPKLIEHPVSAMLGDDFFISGTLDLFTEDGALIDHKTGARSPGNYSSQLGAYSMLLQAADEPYTPETIHIIFMKRVKADKPQPAPIIEFYDKENCEDGAKQTISRIKRDVLDYIKDGNLSAFPMNPSSKLCSSKFCTAFGTSFCSQWKDKGEKSDD